MVKVLDRLTGFVWHMQKHAEVTSGLTTKNAKQLNLRLEKHRPGLQFPLSNCFNSGKKYITEYVMYTSELKFF